MQNLSNLGWTSVQVHQQIRPTGCQDSLEDLDDDNDEICDSNGPSTYGLSSSCVASSTLVDECPANTGNLGWISVSTGPSITDYDIDGCEDGTPEDPDADNDGVDDNVPDNCVTGLKDWTSSPTNDYDGDGCRDIDEDSDDDGDTNHR